MRPEDISKEKYTNWLFEQARIDLGGRPAEIGMTTPRVSKGMKGMRGMPEPGRMALPEPESVVIPSPQQALRELLRALKKFGTPEGGPTGWVNRLLKYITKNFANTDLGRRLIELWRGVSAGEVEWGDIIEELIQYAQGGGLFGVRFRARIANPFSDAAVRRLAWARAIMRMFGDKADGTPRTWIEVSEALGLNLGDILGGTRFGLFGRENNIVTELQFLIGELRDDINFDILNSELRRIVRGSRLSQIFGADDLSRIRRLIEEIQAGVTSGEDFDILALMAKMHELQVYMNQYEQAVQQRFRDYLQNLDVEPPYTEAEIEEVLDSIMEAFFVGGRNPVDTIHENLMAMLKYIMEQDARRF